MNVLDIVIIGLIISFTLVSAAWGLIRQALAVAGLILGLLLAGTLNEPVSKFLGFIDNPTVAKGVAFSCYTGQPGFQYYCFSALFCGWVTISWTGGPSPGSSIRIYTRFIGSRHSPGWRIINYTRLDDTTNKLIPISQ